MKIFQQPQVLEEFSEQKELSFQPQVQLPKPLKQTMSSTSKRLSMPTMRQERDMKMQKEAMKRKRLGFDKHFRLTKYKKLFLNSSRKSVHYWMLCHLQSQPGQTQATQSVQKKLSKMQ
ncbi:MAG: hypothetical protein EBR82_45020 [Caulobacteraceae bacterium]|nr:hypothetical protein [Caulobacteraceae bacterium]